MNPHLRNTNFAAVRREVGNAPWSAPGFRGALPAESEAWVMWPATQHEYWHLLVPEQHWWLAANVLGTPTMTRLDRALEGLLVMGVIGQTAVDALLATLAALGEEAAREAARALGVEDLRHPRGNAWAPTGGASAPRWSDDPRE